MINPKTAEITEGATILTAKDLSRFDKTPCRIHRDKDGSAVLADYILQVDNYPDKFGACVECAELFVWDENTTYEY